MSKKDAKVAALLADIDPQGWSLEYAGFFACFNQGLYYEAHDVLESLWLKDRLGTDGDFYKGLIQLAGAFVHLQKERLSPAVALFKLATKNLSKYPPTHHGLRGCELLALIDHWRSALESNPHHNPLIDLPAPHLKPTRSLGNCL